MKPGVFSWHPARSADEAVALLAEYAPQDGRVIAGGQSLVPSMALRLAFPSHLIDINGVDEFARVRVEGSELVIGACVRHAAFESPVEPGRLGRLLSAVMHDIAHEPIRQRGTFCGSLANADPASEWCLASATLGAKMVAKSVRGTRTIEAADWFQGIMTTALAEDELLAEVRLPLLAADAKAGFYEYSRRAGDYALAMAMVTYREAGGVMRDVRIGTGAVEVQPRRMAAAEALLEGKAYSAAAVDAAAAAVSAAVDPMEDVHTPAEYRRDLVGTAVRRAFTQSIQTGTAPKGR
jgi:carbon-monoxide dehydrogenase medium subunit